ncbi:MAG: LolA family protein [Terriglobales bacterium]
MRRVFFIALACATLALALAGQGTPLHEAVITLDSRYNSIHTWQADFTQTYTAGLQQRTEGGHLFLQKPGKMCWIYTHPARKVFLVAGHHVWQYVAGDNEATVMDVQKLSDMRTPLRFLLGHTDLDRELRDISFSGLHPWQAGDKVIHGLPLKDVAEAGWRELWIEFTPSYRIVRLVIAGLDGSRNDIRFSDIQVNTAIASGRFKLHVPAGVKVVHGG